MDEGGELFKFQGDSDVGYTGAAQITGVTLMSVMRTDPAPRCSQTLQDTTATWATPTLALCEELDQNAPASPGSVLTLSGGYQWTYLGIVKYSEVRNSS